MKKLLLIMIYMGVVEAKEIKICSDNNFWYPFTFEKEKSAKGLHVDIISKALENVGYRVNIEPLTWKRCLAYAKKGVVDAVISASYKKDRATFLHYPPDAATEKKSKWRVTQVEYVIVSHIKDPYEFDGDIKNLPKPVRAPMGYSIIEDLEKEGVKVEEAVDSKGNFTRLFRQQKGIVVTLPQTAKFFQKEAMFKEQFKISTKPLKSKSYFIVFSKKSAISQSEQMKIWENISKIRDDEKIMEELLKKY